MARKFWQSLSPHREGKKGAHPIPVDKTVKRGGMREDTLLKEDHIQEPLLTTLVQEHVKPWCMYIHIHIHSNLVLNLLIFIGDVNITQPCPYDLSSPIPKREMKGRVGRGESLRTTSIQQLLHVSNKHCISN